MKPHKLLDALKTTYKLKNDAALARALRWQPNVLSKMRTGILPVTPERILQIHDATGWEIKRIKGLL
jgi:DNA-binding transcriptional regulator YdaS (Cro superfamily)